MKLPGILFTTYRRSNPYINTRNFLSLFLQKKWMTKSRRVQDRSKKKRVHDLEIATERWKVASKVLCIMDILRMEPEHVMPLKRMERYRQQLSLNNPHTVSDFIRKSRKLFEIFRDKNGATWCGLTKKAEDLMDEEAHLIEKHQEKAAEYVSRMLMMSVDKRLALDKIANFRRDIGLPRNFRDHWVHLFPQYFKSVKVDGIQHLELVSWNPAWAITELEKNVRADVGAGPSAPGTLSLSFPLKFPPEFKKIFRIGGKLEHFQRQPYLSPYADARNTKPGSLEFDKRAVAIMHELLNFTLEKRLVTIHLTHFREEFLMPQKLMRLLLKYFGIFYVSERGKMFHVFLTEAYEGSELIKKPPLVLWKEKILRLTGYRGKKRGIKHFDEFSDPEEHRVSSDEISLADSGDEEIAIRIDSPTDDDDEIKIEDIYDAYDTDST